jgi:hypothetical protein
VANGGTGVATLTGLAKGNGTGAFTAAVAGTDFVSPSGLTTTLSSYVTSTSLTTTLSSYAPLASPALTGTPTAPTAGAGTNTTQLATTAFVSTAVANGTSGIVSATTTNVQNAMAASSAWAVGTYIIGRPADSASYTVGTTVAGTSLYATSTGASYNGGWNTGAGQVLVNTGTWRCMSPTNASGANGFPGLWLRIS